MSAMMTRRQALMSVVMGVGGGWTLGWANSAPGATNGQGFSPWLRFTREGLTVLTPICELGQGTTGLLGLIAAEELELPPSWVTVESAPVEPRYKNPVTGDQVTYGSIGFRSAYSTLAPVCAAARAMFASAAAKRLGAVPSDLRLRDGWFFDSASTRRIRLLDLVDEASLLTPPDVPAPKRRNDWSVLGKKHLRSDIPDKTTGRTVFGIDTTLPGLLYAAVIHGPGFDTRLGDLNEEPVRGMQGVRRVVRLPGAVAVVADSFWTAHKACQALKPTWLGGASMRDSDAYAAELRAAVQIGGERDYSAALDQRLQPQACDSVLLGAPTVLEEIFQFPFLAHAPMEPLSATVQILEHGAEVWISTQAPTATQLAIAQTLQVRPELIGMHVRPAGGGFGRRLEVDVAVEATLIARAVGLNVPVKTIWSREVDMTSGFFRPASAAKVRLALGHDALPTALRVDMAGGRIEDYSAVAGEPDAALPDQASRMGWLDSSYHIPLLRLAFTRVDRGVPLAYWRAVGASQNAFALETMIDLAARVAKVDPMAYRARLLMGDSPRLVRVRALLAALAVQSDWERPLPAGRYRGVAISEANRTICGHVVEVSIPNAGQLHIDKIFAIADVGWVGNPDAVNAQLMGGTVFGLSAALFGEIEIASGDIIQRNFDTYRLLRLSEMPHIDLKILENGERPGGVGEEAVPSIGPAVANALLAATGQAVTRLPLSRAGWTLV